MAIRFQALAALVLGNLMPAFLLQVTHRLLLQNSGKARESDRCLLSCKEEIAVFPPLGGTHLEQHITGSSRAS